MKIAFISCVSKKKQGIWPAKELYISDLFLKSLYYTTNHFDKVYILSAKYGLVALTQKIESYNLTLNTFTEQELKIWSYKVLNDIKIHIGEEGHEFYFFCGKRYRKYLMQKLTPSFAPLAHLGIGKQLAWYKKSRDK